MKASELRIGNLIQDVKHKKAKKIILFLGLNDFTFDEYPFLGNEELFFDINIDKIEPIPLTEWLLSNSGFVITETNKCLEAFYFGIRFSLRMNIVDNNFWLLCDKDLVLMEIQYYHDLQNIFSLLAKVDITLNK